MKVVVIGGGIIGLSCAYYLQKKGFDITVVDNTQMTDGASYGNAGHIVPSHFVPLASPGIVSQGLRWMLNSSSPFYIKPRLDVDLMRWGYTFWRQSGIKTMQRNITPLQQLLFISRNLFDEVKNELGNSFFMIEKGILILYKTLQTENHELAMVKLAATMGLEAEILSASSVQQLESTTTINTRGGILYKADAHLHPALFMEVLKTFLLNAGVKFLTKTLVTAFEKSGNKITAVVTDNEKIIADEFVLANGAWLAFLTKKLGFPLLMQAGKGYSLTCKNFKPLITYPAILADHRVVTTPVGLDFRLAGTMEINGHNSPMMPKRVNAIIQSAKQYYPDLNIPPFENLQVWSGLRPLSPDGLPYIGRHKNIKNMVIAGGHAMLGLSLATGTGKLVQEIICNENLSMPIHSFNVERFG